MKERRLNQTGRDARQATTAIGTHRIAPPRGPIRGIRTEAQASSPKSTSGMDLAPRHGSIGARKAAMEQGTRCGAGLRLVQECGRGFMLVVGESLSRGALAADEVNEVITRPRALMTLDNLPRKSRLSSNPTVRSHASSRRH